MKIAVTIQCDSKHCCWCHFNKRVEHVMGPIRFCEVFCKRLEEDKRGAIRLEKCKEAQV